MVMGSGYGDGPGGGHMAQNRLKAIREQQEALKKQAQRRDEKIASRIQQSGTRKLLNGVFFVLYLTTGIQFILKVGGFARLLGNAWNAFSIGILPFFWYKPAVPDILIGGTFPVSKVHLLALAVYIPVHVLLLNIHRAILEERVQTN